MTELLKINERWIKFKDKVICPKELDRNKTIILKGEFDHYHYEEELNQDGTIDPVYVLKPIRVYVDAGNEKIYLETNNKQSTKTRYAIKAIQPEFRPDMDPEDFYNLIQGGIRHDLRNIINNILRQ